MATWRCLSSRLPRLARRRFGDRLPRAHTPELGTARRGTDHLTQPADFHLPTRLPGLWVVSSPPVGGPHRGLPHGGRGRDLPGASIATAGAWDVGLARGQ